MDHFKIILPDNIQTYLSHQKINNHHLIPPKNLIPTNRTNPSLILRKY